MNLEFAFDDQEKFLSKLRELRQSGLIDITTFTPYPVHDIDEILHESPSKLKIFTLSGATTGFFTGLVFTIYTVTMWPIITGGKPLISLPPFLIIAYVLTILFGAIASFLGFLFLTRLPNPGEIIPDHEYGNQFVILVKEEK